MIKSSELRKPSSQNGGGRSAFKMLTGKPTVKRLFGRPRRKRDDNIRIHLNETGINTRNWVDSSIRDADNT